MKPIICDGLFSEDNEKYLINLNSIFSYLIKQTGLLVEEYCSDILIDCKIIEDYATDKLNLATKIFWVGLREGGVDHEEFIKHRCDNNYYYRGLYKIVVEKNLNKCVVTLYKSDAYEFRKEHNIAA